MSNPQAYIRKLFEARHQKIAEADTQLFDRFMQQETITNAAQLILNTQQTVMDKWQVWKRADEIIRQNIYIPNATVGKPYEAKLDFIQLGWNDIVQYELTGLENIGLSYDHTGELLTGTPTDSGDIKLTLTFKLSGEPEETPLHEKAITLIVNPNARLLWKDILSNKEDPFWKEDTATALDDLSGKKIVAASKRGRSHANTGCFRDDDFAFQHYAATGWNIVVVADGAGSAKLAREGSRLACAAVVNYFAEHLTTAVSDEFETVLTAYLSDENKEVASKSISQFIYQHLSKAAFFVHQHLAQKTTELSVTLKDFHTTLSFTLFKKFNAGYAFLSFGVGDSPMAVLDINLSEVTLLNTLDVGTYGGGTRFITMPEIFQADTFASRFRFKWLPDFAYLLLMTDGIYDPKFSVEAALEKVENWQELIADLKGVNEDGVALNFSYDNPELPAQLSTWLDFWSPGNHDDRTLAIVF